MTLFFKKNLSIYEIVWKHVRAGQATDNNKTHVDHMLDN
jgi:hypothetical protein